MYAKVFRSMYDGSLADNWRALVTFQQLLVLANADGVVDMTASAIARTTGIPLDLIQEGLAALEAIDPESRTPEMDGRRIARLDTHRSWGWFIVNHKHYRELQHREEKLIADRERMRSKRSLTNTQRAAVVGADDTGNVPPVGSANTAAGGAEGALEEPAAGPAGANVAGCRSVSQVVAACSAVSPNVANVAYTDTDIDTKDKEQEQEQRAHKIRTRAAAATTAMIRGGIPRERTNQQHPELLALVEDPRATPEMFEATAEEAPEPKAMMWVVRTMTGRLGAAARQGKHSKAANNFARTEPQRFERGALSEGKTPSWLEESDVASV